ncbi:hypothetical protein P692DRAFT_20842844 [Suillus brevipes Sb2]|nr:hypothetical protein P692DRAFT_20842844 [Suillus brevipes Sb2]
MLVPMNFQLQLPYLAEFQQLSEDFSTIVEPSYSKPAFDFPTDIGPSATQSGIGHSSRWSSSILEAHSAVFSAPIPERPTDFFAEQNVYEVSSRERQIQETRGRANHLYISLENEHSLLKVNVHEYHASKSVPTQNAVIHETIVQPAGYVNDAIAPVRHQPQYIAPSAANITGRYSDEKETQAEDDTKTEPGDDAKTEPDDGIDEKDVNAEVPAHAILDIPLPPPIVACVQFLGQRKRRNSCCREGITRMRVKRRQMNTEEGEEDGDGSEQFNFKTCSESYVLELYKDDVRDLRWS